MHPAGRSTRRRRQGVSLVVAASLACGGALALRTRGPAEEPGGVSYLRGLNAAGADFGTGSRFDSDASFAFYASRGTQLVRLPFRWESVQPSRGAALDPAYLDQLASAVASSTSRGMTTVLDVHNYHRYDGAVVGGGVVGRGDVADLWTRLARAFQHDPLVEFALMNEPHDVPGGTPAVEQIAQEAVTAIRATGATNFIRVSGDEWSSAASFADRHPTWWVQDPLGRSGPEGHYYLDAGNQRIGTYPRSIAVDEAAAREQGFASLADKVQTELGRFVAYCRDQRVRCLLGEIGWPNDTDASQHPDEAAAWNAVGEVAYRVLDEGGLDVAYWAAGEQWGTSYGLSLYTGSPQAVPTSSAEVVEAHRSSSPRPETALSLPAAPPAAPPPGSTTQQPTVQARPGRRRRRHHAGPAARRWSA